MATALQIIERALKRAKVLQSMESASADEAQDALERLNDMLSAWELQGIPTNHTTLSLTDTLPLEDNHIEPITDNLAVRLVNDYGVTLTPLLAASAEYGFSTLVSLHSKADSELSTAADSF